MTSVHLGEAPESDPATSKPCAFCEVVRLQHALDERTRERDAGRYYLKMLAERLGVPLDGAHDANPGERILLAVETLLVDAQCCY